MNEKNDKEIIEVKEVEAERINNNETFRPRFKAIRLSPTFSCWNINLCNYWYLGIVYLL